MTFVLRQLSGLKSKPCKQNLTLSGPLKRNDPESLLDSQSLFFSEEYPPLIFVLS